MKVQTVEETSSIADEAAVITLILLRGEEAWMWKSD